MTTKYNRLNLNDIDKSEIIMKYIDNNINNIENMKQIIKLNNKHINKDFCDNKTLFTLLLYKNCNIDILKYILTYKCNINNIDNNNYYPIFYTIINNNIEHLQLLLKYNVNINVCSNNMNCLILCINYNRLEILKLLLSNDLNINNNDLFKININNGYDTLKYLINNNYLDINILDDKYNNILINAVLNKNTNFIKWLCKTNINIDYYNKDNKNALYYSLINGCYNISDYLIKYGSNLNETIIKTKIMYNMCIQCNYILLEYLLIHNVSIYDKSIIYFISNIKNELEKDYYNDINIYLNGNDKQLFIERNKYFNNYYKFIHILINNGIKISNLSNNILLINAIQNNDIDNVNKYIKLGYDINFIYKNKSCLMYGINNYDITKLLIDNGAYINYVNDDNENILKYTINNQNLQIIQLLINNGCDYNYLCNNKHIIFYFVNNINILKYFIEELNVNINILDDNNNNLLYYTIYHNDDTIIKYLLHKNINTNNVNNENKCILFYYIYNNKYNYANLILNNTNINLLYNISFNNYNNLNIIEYLHKINFDFNKNDCNNNKFEYIINDKYNNIFEEYKYKINKIKNIYNNNENNNYIFKKYNCNDINDFKNNYNNILNNLQNEYNKYKIEYDNIKKIINQ